MYDLGQELNHQLKTRSQYRVTPELVMEAIEQSDKFVFLTGKHGY